MARKAPTLPGTRTRPQRSAVYVREIPHPVAKHETAEITLRPVYMAELDHARRAHPKGGFALKLAIVKRAIVSWSLHLEPSEGIERLPDDAVDAIFEHVQILDARRVRRARP